jgi:hypothetical protein
VFSILGGFLGTGTRLDFFLILILERCIDEICSEADRGTGGRKLPPIPLINYELKYCVNKWC